MKKTTKLLYFVTFISLCGSGANATCWSWLGDNLFTPATNATSGIMNTVSESPYCSWQTTATIVSTTAAIVFAVLWKTKYRRVIKQLNAIENDQQQAFRCSSMAMKNICNDPTSSSATALAQASSRLLEHTQKRLEEISKEVRPYSQNQ